MSFLKLQKPLSLALLMLMTAPALADETKATTAPDTEVEQASDEPSEFGLLKVADGVETTYYSCTACHSEMIIAQQGLSREHWDDMLDWMVEEQGMAELDEPDRTEILDYLTAHYNEDRPNFPQR